MPPVVAVKSPQSATIARDEMPWVSAAWAPTMEKAPRPMVSPHQSTDLCSTPIDSSHSDAQNVASEVPKHRPKKSGSRNQKTGSRPRSMSRMVPPPIAEMVATYVHPNRSIPACPATRVPDAANAIVPP